MSIIDKIQTFFSFFGKWVTYILILFFGYLVLSSFYFVVAPSERGLKMTLWTLNETVYSEGIHWKIPFIETIKFADLHIDKADGDARSASKDLQNRW